MRLLIISAILLLTYSCLSDNSPCSSFHVPDELNQDSLLVDIVTYIGRKPRVADYITRHNPEHREFYQLQAQEFRIVYYHVTEDGTHYYYIIRPARSVHGNLRGVGGKFRLTSDDRIDDFSELFNTPVLTEELLIQRGCELFSEMTEKGTIEQFLDNSDYIEWPDERLKYDEIRKEWRYDLSGR